jgi:predicted dehydrogenase
MKVLLGDRWTDGVLDPHCGTGEVRVQVQAWLPLAPLDDLYFRRPHSPRLVWNYAREIGLRATWAKIASRHEERFRNQAFLAVGVGRVLEAPGAADLLPGAAVELIATRHPRAIERAVVPRGLVQPAFGVLLERLEPKHLLLLRRGEGVHELPAELAQLGGFSLDSGAALDAELVRCALAAARRELLAACRDEVQRLPLDAPSPIAERRHAEVAMRPRAAKSAVLFGYGNYAKTALLPNLVPGIALEAIHEIDPLQMPATFHRSRGRRAAAVAWDTAPSPRPDERYDVSFIAGFHHTHAPLAAQALCSGGVAVVEKPLVTNSAQLDELLSAMRAPGRRLFACFHKRYSPFNAMVREDLRIAPGDPISMHAIVYEVPLPPRHWYRWPSSRSCIVSNGCHWLDHFLYLNGFAAVREATLAVGESGAVSCTVSLDNGAFSTLTLTHEGSARLGVRDHVELRANGACAVIENGARYVAEDSTRVLRRRRENRVAIYARMYREISRRILSGEDGDSPRSVEVSSRLMLRLDEMLRERLDARSRGRAAPVALRRIHAASRAAAR